jgi:hypothetical protein
MKYELDPFHRDIPDEELLADLRRVAEDLGKHRVTFREYKERGRFAPRTLAERFSSWFAAIDKANPQRTMNRNISDGDPFVNLVEVWTVVGRQPTDHTCSHTTAESLASGSASATVPLAEINFIPEASWTSWQR